MEVDLNAEVPPGLSFHIIPETEYALFEAKDALSQSLTQAWKTIWQSSLRKSYQTDFEMYDPALLASLPLMVPIYIGVDPS